MFSQLQSTLFIGTETTMGVLKQPRMFTVIYSNSMWVHGHGNDVWEQMDLQQNSIDRTLMLTADRWI